ncbi:MAG: hypothetical protein HOD90_01655 [Nitrospina sp.]|nr:hypothetical protein [Nitrospina sp.]
MHINKFSAVIKPLLAHLSILFLSLTFFISSSLAGVVEPLPGLEKAIEELHFLYKDKELSFLVEKEYQVQKYYYEIQSKTQKLEVLEEVKEHFEKAVAKSEEKFDSGEEDISQSAITKLKLGLAGTLNDIIELNTDIKVAFLSLTRILKVHYSVDIELRESEIKPIDFKFKDYKTWFVDSGLATIMDSKLDLSGIELELKTGFLKVLESREKLKLAKKNRKITRALLVSEAANYDFGIGEAGDLFEALIIYTRVLSGYYDSVYNFNLSTVELNRIKSKGTANP